MFRLTAPAPQRQTPIDRLKEPIDRLVHRGDHRSQRGPKALRGRRARRGRRTAPGKRSALIAGAGVGLGAIVLGSSRRRQTLAGRTRGLVRRRSHDYDDVTLARKVESEIFRPADAPKGDVDVNAHDGVVELRGVVADNGRIEALVRAAEHVDGVERVENLLHLPGTPARHAPPARSSLEEAS